MIYFICGYFGIGVVVAVFGWWKAKDLQAFKAGSLLGVSLLWPLVLMSGSLVPAAEFREGQVSKKALPLNEYFSKGIEYRKVDWNAAAAINELVSFKKEGDELWQYAKSRENCKNPDGTYGHGVAGFVIVRNGLVIKDHRTLHISYK